VHFIIRIYHNTRSSECQTEHSFMFQDLSVHTCSTIKLLFKKYAVLFLRTTCIFQLTEKRILSMVYYFEFGIKGNTLKCYIISASLWLYFLQALKYVFIPVTTYAGQVLHLNSLRQHCLQLATSFLIPRRQSSTYFSTSLVTDPSARSPAEIGVRGK
jgi:hypothetical protein